MFILMVIIFVLGYTAIALEHPLRVDKAATALLLGMLMWVVYILGSQEILTMVNSAGEFVSSAWGEYVKGNPAAAGSHEEMRSFISHEEVLKHLAEISEILFFLLGAMTIVEIVDQHQGFKTITDRISATNKVKLLWIISILTFFMSAVLDNLTTTIVMIALLRKLIDDKETKWFFASMVVVSANAGGAWTPIGDVTTIMLWIGGQVTAWNIMVMVFIPSIITILVPLLILTFTMKGAVTRPVIQEEANVISSRQQLGILIMGVGALLFVPVFKTYTHLPPYMGMLFGLSILWATTEILHRWHDPKKLRMSGIGDADAEVILEGTQKLTVIKILTRVDVPTVLFFLGILSAVAALQSAGQLGILANFLDEKLGNIYLINIAIGLLSSIIDNVPLVAGAMGMYPVAEAGATGYAANFMVDGTFWEFLAYCAGTGGSILIIGSAAGVAAMGMEKIDFIWYVKKISLLALLGYLAGAGAYYLQMAVLEHV
jgi:Na+/H+ antiporter NhaD/arsenite permease-like protein